MPPLTHAPSSRALEYDAPDALMARPDSAFRALAVEQRVA
jgi:hypothetical protein